MPMNSKPRPPTQFDWVAPEHFRDAQSMTRNRAGELIIKLNPIFEYSRKNPPEFLAGAIRKMKERNV